MYNDKETLDDHVLSSLTDRILTITLNRPDKRNAITYPMYESLTRLLVDADKDATVRVVVLAGAGEFFTSGNDVNSFKFGAGLAYNEKPSFHFMNALACCSKPVIAAVNGNAIGIGVTMLLHCDLIYATEGSQFKLPFLSMGFVPEFASTLLLAASIGYSKAAELLMIGDTFTSAQAETLGFINQATAADNLQDLVRSRALNLASKPPEALQTTKRLMKKHANSLVVSTIDEEAREFSKCLQRPETQAIVASFLNRNNNKAEAPSTEA